ncbi:MAG: phosphate signaling complex protein PhoU [Kiritimatiellia bacterium]
MTQRLQKEIENLKKKLLTLCSVVEKAVMLATKAVEEDDSKLAEQVIKDDVNIDNSEVELEEDCLKILALYQPVAVDLRIIVAILKINSDLERIGDLAVNVAERVSHIGSGKPTPEKFGFPAMMEHVTQMLRNGIDAMVKMDEELAYSVCAADDKVDEMNRRSYELAESMIGDKDISVKTLIDLLSVSRHLERIADHATNIAEDVVYMIEGEVIRHHVGDHSVEEE